MRHVLISLALLLSSCAVFSGKPQKIDQHSHANPSQVRVKHVDLDLTLDFDTKSIRGVATLNIERIDRGAPLILDVQDLEIESVLGTDGSTRNTIEAYFDEDLTGGSLLISLEDGDESVSINYRTEPSSEALQWLSPEQTAGGKSPFLFSQGEPILTRSWIPLQDSPGVRVTYTARIHAPEGLVPVMSAESFERNEDGSTTFRMTKAIPPYLIALACGDLAFEAISDRCGVWADPTILKSAAAELEDTEQMIVSAEELFGPYRFGRYDILILPPAFPFGGMENPCLTFATPTILAGDKSLVSLVAHELAHSWSGNLVTNATWSDFWLNEGFTVFFESRIMEAVYGADRALMENELSYDGLIAELAGTEECDTVLNIDLTDRHPDDGFSGIPYNKGALFLRRLEAVFGRDAFDIFLRSWFDSHAFQSVTTAEFMAFLDAELLSAYPELAKDVDADQWVYGTGLPATAPDVPSKAMAAVDVQLAAYQSDSANAASLQTAGWVTQQWQHFLSGLPDSATSETLAELDEAFEFTASGNSEILCDWLQLTIKHGYQPADARLEAFLERVGRAKFLIPLYTELVKASPERATELYARYRSRYHAVAFSRLDNIVGN
ncbi:MAG: leukotriene-A4 hydrolase [Planctomycetota bacterium]|jgi:leukotriene-A4 hydrolase